MAYTTTATFAQSQAMQHGSEPIHMYVLNASKTGTNFLYYVNYNQNVYGYGLDSDGNILSATQLYTGVPIGLDALHTDTSGEISDVNITVPNVDRVIESFIQSQNYLRGREVYILTTFAKYLPSGGSSSHIGSSPDKNAIVKEKLYVDSTTSDDQVVSFTCKPKFTITRVQIPGRTYTRECSWALKGRYLATECDPLASVNSASYPTCDGSLNNCKIRNNVKRFGGFPSVPRRGITIV